ncbi:sensor histidine kinase [Streptomyces scabiei]|uniref:ATP-binding protein n=1 Tax=Streptomyces scabiei TaxID=1930 RepID=UPI00369EACC7
MLANALRVSPPGTTITLATRPGPEGVALHVIDQGPGMSKAERKRAFDHSRRPYTGRHDRRATSPSPVRTGAAARRPAPR